MVFQFVFSGTTFTVAMSSGIGGWTLIASSAAGADNVEIQAAINYLDALGGGKLYLARANFLIAATINPCSNLWIDGSGYGTILTQADGVNLGLGIIWTNNKSNVHISNIHLEGNTANNPTGNYGILVRRCNNVLIDKCFFNDIQNHAVGFSTAGGETGENCVLSNSTFTNVDSIAVTAAALGDLTDILVINNYMENILNLGFYAERIRGIKFIGNTLKTSNRGLFCFACEEIVVSGNTLIDANQGTIFYGSIQFQGSCKNGVISSNTIKYATNPSANANGIVVQADQEDMVISSNTLDGQSLGNVANGIYLHGTDVANIDVIKVTILGNVLKGFDGGILLTYAQDIIVSANVIEAITGGYPATDDAIWIGNKFICTTGIADAGENNFFIGNDFKDCTTPVAAARTHIFPYIPFPFVQGTTFISADGSAKGWEINAEADMAIILGQLPLEVQQVVRIKIWAVALGAPAGAGGQMHLDILFNAGGSLEAWNLAANSWVLANFDGEEADYVNTNVIHWVIEDGDVGNELVNLLGGDSLELKVNGGTAVAPDGATNATFRAIEVEYV